MTLLTQDRLDQYAAMVAQMRERLDARKAARQELLGRSKEYDPSQPRDEIGRWTDTLGNPRHSSGIDSAVRNFHTTLRAKAPQIAARHGLPTSVIKGVYVVGSRARGTNRPDSDADFLVLTQVFEDYFAQTGGNRAEAITRWEAMEDELLALGDSVLETVEGRRKVEIFVYDAIQGLALKETGEKAALPSAEDYDVVRARFVNGFTEALVSYAATGGAGGRSYRNRAGRLVLEGVAGAFESGLKDAGADETDADDSKWMVSVQNAQLKYLPGVFVWLKQSSAAETITESAIVERVGLWANTLDAIYLEGKLRGSRNITLVFGGPDGDESCETCTKLKGQKHTVKWILDHDMIPRPGNSNFDCGGWRCQHGWFTKSGDRFGFQGVQ